MGGNESKLVGRRVGGRYRLVRRIAVGGMATVFLAEDLPLERPVAVKLAAMAATFLRREARILANLDHAAIPPVYEMGDLGASGAYLVMPWIPGDPLGAVIRRTGPMGPRQAIAIGLALGEAVRHIHGRGIVHCDIKPSNVLLREDDSGRNIALLDFGVADNPGRFITRLARTGKLLGTPTYLAPEALLGSSPDPRTDVYGICATLYHLLTGTSPVPRTDDLAATLVAVAEGRVVPLAARRPDLPEELVALVHRGLSTDPANRPAYVDALLEQLRAVDVDRRPPRRSETRQLRRVREMPACDPWNIPPTRVRSAG